MCRLKTNGFSLLLILVIAALFWFICPPLSAIGGFTPCSPLTDFVLVTSAASDCETA